MLRQRDVKPQQIRVRDRVRPVCAHGDCEDGAIWDFKTCWPHLIDVERQALRDRLSAALRAGDDLSQVVLTRAELIGFDFRGANLSGAFLDQCDLNGANFEEANLRGAYFGWADLEDADLTRSEIHGAVFTNANLKGIHLSAMSLRHGRVPVNIDMPSFGEEGIFRRPHVYEKYPEFAEATYRALKAYFVSEGYYDSASWASFSERLMQRRVLWQDRRFFSWAASWLFGTLSGYGERPLRTLLASLVAVAGWAFIYSLDHIIVIHGTNPTLGDALVLSLATFSGYSLPDPPTTTNLLGHFLLAFEAFAGLFVFGLFIFTLTKRYVAR